ncbi:MAG: dTDP-glucose 4,6-dehydratase [Candidatus Uhrbacteria bacterium]|nr:dTDP-glucose 4,6-dehydratase [Patescibacteria group bacterium]MBU1663758.1 dTDP-glucose 4,6-dehydratase [Patescibacteria group bacterium]MBU1906812.1 dTDP-glucose 4,6-dehydratase [Patescibacteria group bacterium]
MTILVTGGAGFIGSNFILYMMKKYPDYKIVNLDALTYCGNLRNLESVQDNPNYKFVKGDVTDRDLVFDLVKAVDLIVHFAAESHVDRSIMDARPFVMTNVLGTLNLLDAALKHSKRMHHVSTDEVFGALGPDDPAFNEETCYAPRNPYSACKAGSDHLVRSYNLTHGLPITISNCSNNYGAYQFPEKVIPLFISNLKEDKKVPVYGQGLQIRDWIHVEDHCKGIDAIIHKGKIGETYCLGGKNSEIPNIELTKKIIAAMGKSEDMIEFVKDRAGHDARYSIDYSKAKEELGWEPEIDLETGMKMTVDWYLANQDWVDEIRSGDYEKYYEAQYLKR